MELRNYFDRCVVINLRRRPDRLETFMKEIATDWPFLMPEIVPAVDGRAVPHPSHWKGGAGAWGCSRSHLHVLEQAMSDGVERLLVMEDDCAFVDDFSNKVSELLAVVPSFDQLMLGGQHIGAAHPTTFPGVVKCNNCQRTHCYALTKGTYIKHLYQSWLRYDSHIDWAMGGMQSRYKVYAPDPFLTFQSSSFSDITCRQEPRRWWSKVKSRAIIPSRQVVVVLRANRDVVDELAKLGWHRGFWLDPVSGQDNGLRRIVDDAGDHRLAPDVRERVLVDGLREWISLVGTEAAQVKGGVLTIWHQDIPLSVVTKSTTASVVEISGLTADECVRGLDASV